jgi:hypothetical protein
MTDKEFKKIIEKIKAEFYDLNIYYDNDFYSDNDDAMYKCTEVMAILDKYL